ncbi:MAG: helix-turn-helix domain-containing protein [Candidatus Aminicenantes bacterium]|nr:helix-turn-helix domain-containing protein [Candidatus Aminicenantes bacterium]NIM77222.1 helix-turn-helix domain-containing protein [Candidatus Aminicenantes bacterium]NIN16518.1 helix-turn-helix domain-containing protein [Candidatus Aminicenantes bacterium]NIN40378.1 helix-turn-helix domain-containing protein [Candidatus Aminicenantes bacterium]NIN83198.1 helix-turn-helix domain-containing protein [Candidatus Aminicenantes bacterium]
MKSFVLSFHIQKKQKVEMKRIDFTSTKKLLASIILVQLFCCPSWGLDPDKRVDQYLVDQWNTADGIPSNSIHAIEQTPDGYLWIAASKGLVRFDGIEFSNIPLVEKAKIDPLKTIILDTLFLDNEESLWIGSSGGVTSYHYQTDRFKTFTRNRIRRILKDVKGNFWISLWDGYVNRFSNGRFIEFNAAHGLEGKRINGIVEDIKGNLLFGTRDNGVFKYKEDKFFKYPIKGLEGHSIVYMYGDRKGELWIGTMKGLFRVTDKRTLKYTTADGLSNDHIIYILEDSERNFWIGTLKGLNRIKKKQNGEVSFERLLSSFTILCLFEDSEKSLWVGTYDSGIKRLKDGKFISYAPVEAIREKMLFSMFEDRQGDKWIGTVSGKLFRFRSGCLMESLEPPGLSGTGIGAIVEDAQGNLWLGTNGKGVLQKKKKTFVQFTTREGLADNIVTSIYKDRRSNLWFSTFDGVSVRYPHGTIESFKFRDGLSGKTVNNVYEDKNHNIWIAADKGITVLEDGRIANQKPSFYLQGVSITCIYEDPYAADSQERIFWIATYGAGLKRLNVTDGTVISYTTADGMTTNSIFRFFEDQQGNFWLMSDSGILRVLKAELNRFARGDPDKINCISYGISDGMKSREFNNRLSTNSALQSRNGELWFLTKKGISIVTPGKIRINKVPPPVVIETAFFDGKSIPLHQDEHVCKGIKYFQFHFTALTFLSPEKIKFQYQLEGFEKEWVFLPPGRGRVAHYWNLDPGTYTFRVIASNAEGVWNRTGDSLIFTLKPFFYQTSLFKIGMLILVGVLAAAAALYIYKKRPFEKKEKYKGSPLKPLFIEECIKKLTRLMENEKIYRDENISLQSLAEKLSISSHLLSQIINEKLNRNFPDYINSYRIEEAKEILKTPRGTKVKITIVAQEVGFNSMTAFYKAFKKYTNMTPNQYKEEIKKK